MINALSEINWSAVLVAASVYYLLGIPWFAPRGLGRVWAQAIGFKEYETQKPKMYQYLVPFLSSFAASICLALLARVIGLTTASDGLVLGAVVALGFSVALSGTYAVTPNNPRPLRLFLITGSYHFISILIVTLIVTVWR